MVPNTCQSIYDKREGDETELQISNHLSFQLNISGELLHSATFCGGGMWPLAAWLSWVVSHMGCTASKLSELFYWEGLDG